MEQVKPLPILQGNVLAAVFRESFPEEELAYFSFVDIDEIFLEIIGGNSDTDIYELLSDSCKYDVNSYVNLIDLTAFLEVVIEQAEDLQFFEVCHNCKVISDKFKTILKQTDEYYTRDGCYIS